MAENETYMFLCILMPSDLQLYCTRLLPSRTLRLCVHARMCLCVWMFVNQLCTQFQHQQFWSWKVENISVLAVLIHMAAPLNSSTWKFHCFCDKTQMSPKQESSQHFYMWKTHKSSPNLSQFHSDFSIFQLDNVVSIALEFESSLSLSVSSGC